MLLTMTDTFKKINNNMLGEEGWYIGNNAKY